jgi:hypothetical protein
MLMQRLLCVMADLYQRNRGGSKTRCILDMILATLVMRPNSLLSSLRLTSFTSNLHMM